MELRHFLPALFAFALLTGCNKEEKATYAPMGASAPAFSADSDTVADFIEGRWALEGGFEGEADQSEIWQFSSDGTFFYSQGESERRVHGSWTESNGGVSLTYEKLDDETIMEARARLQKGAESGAQAAIANQMAIEGMLDRLIPKNYFELSDDGKKLEIQDPSVGSGDLFGISLSTVLIRLQEVKD